MKRENYAVPVLEVIIKLPGLTFSPKGDDQLVSIQINLEESRLTSCRDEVQPLEGTIVEPEEPNMGDGEDP